MAWHGYRISARGESRAGGGTSGASRRCNPPACGGVLENERIINFFFFGLKFLSRDFHLSM